MGKTSKKKQAGAGPAQGGKLRGHKPRGSRKSAAVPAKPRAINDETTARISQALADVVAEAGLYLESVRAMRAGGTRIVQVVVDLPWGPGGVDSDSLTEVSRAISARLDDVDLVEGAYNLEVSTPGADRKLVEARHFSRAEGRLVEIRLADGGTLVGRVESVAGDLLNLATEAGERSVRLNDIESARVRIELGHSKDEER